MAEGILDALGGWIREYDASRPRSKQAAIGPSEIGSSCLRRIAFKLLGVPEVETAEIPWAAFQGTCIHEGLAKVLEWKNEQLGRRRFWIEQRVYASERINGKGDAFDTDELTVIDWKYVGLSTIEAAVVSGGVSPTYAVQAHTYGLGYLQAGYDVRHVLVVLLARDARFSQSAEFRYAFEPRIAEEAIARERTVARVLGGQTADQIPASPGSECRFCPWHKGGEPASPVSCPGGSRLAPSSTSQLIGGR